MQERRTMQRGHNENENTRKYQDHEAQKREYLENQACAALKEIGSRIYFKQLKDPKFKKIIELVIAGTDEGISLEKFLTAIRTVGINGTLGKILETMKVLNHEDKIPYSVFLEAIENVRSR